MELFTDSLHKIAYSADASVYREIPYGVAYPETVDDVRELFALAREKGVDLIPRAGGTSIAGQVVGAGIVVDVSKHWNKIIEINAEERWARVQPGVVRDELNLALKPYGLFFSPETSTSNRCCMGGMFGNNSCGTHSLVYGSTRHHVIAAKGVLADGNVEEFRDYQLDELEERFGKRFWEKTSHESLIESIYAQLVGFAYDEKTVSLIADHYPDKELNRRSCGYAIDEVIENLTPNGDGSINLCKLLAGSEGTLAFITELTVSLDPLPPKEMMVVCGHCDNLMKSFEGNLVALRHHPTAIELMDGEILELSKGNSAIHAQLSILQIENPAALLITELRAENREDIDRKADALEQDLLQSGLVYKCTRVYGADVAKVWNLRKAGLGILGGMKGDARPMGVIEDTAVAPSRLPAYMRDFRDMLGRLDAKCVFYGHISTGELHLRPIINLKTKEGRELFRKIAYETALLVKKHRGSISGEHGDGRLRGEFIPLLYGQEAYELMRQVKHCWDPENLLNRHKIVDTLPMDSMLRFDEGQQYVIENTIGADHTYYNWKAAFDECDTPGATGARSQTHALMCSIEQCNGAGDCRKSNLMGGTMCPAFKVSGDETKTTRARANVLREVLTRGGDAQLVKEVLDSCLACKGCRGECPSNVDLTKIRAELLQHYYDQHGMPLRTWLVARLLQIEQMGRYVRPLYNFAAQWKPTASIIKHIVKFAPERSIPQLSKRTMVQLVTATVSHGLSRREEEATVSHGLSRREEEATVSHGLSRREEEATVSHGLSRREEEATVSHGLSRREEEATVSHGLSRREEEATVSHGLSRREEEATVSHGLSRREEEATVSHGLSRREEEATVSHGLSRREEEATVSHGLSRREEEATVSHGLSRREEEATVSHGLSRREERGKRVLLYADEFTNQQEAELGLTFAKLLMRLGYQVETVAFESGRTAISKGCLKRAKKIATKNVQKLSSLNSSLFTLHSSLFTLHSSLLVGLEPSAVLTFRDEYPDLVPAELRAEAIRIGKSCLLYDEFLQQEMANGNICAEDFKADEMEIWLHGHCHQKALVGIDKTANVLRTLLRGAKVHVIPSGCCGMAGSFGYEKEHYKTSLAIGEMILFPAIRRAYRSKSKAENLKTPFFVAAPGTSCRQQILDGTGVRAVHPIEILYRYVL